MLDCPNLKCTVIIEIYTLVYWVYGYWQLFSFWSIFDIGLLRVHPMAILFILILPLAHIEHRIYRIIAFFFLWPYFAFYQFDFLEIYFSTSSGFAVAAAIFMRWKLFKTSEVQSFWNQFLSPAENTIPYHFKFHFSEKTKYQEEVLVITQRGATTANHLMVWNSGELAFQTYILRS